MPAGCAGDGRMCLEIIGCPKNGAIRSSNSWSWRNPLMRAFWRAKRGEDRWMGCSAGISRRTWRAPEVASCSLDAACERGRPRLESGGRCCASASGAASTCDLQGKPQHGAMEITWASRRTGAASWGTAAESIWGHLSVGLVHFCPSRSPCDVAWPKAHSAARYRRVKAFFSQREGHKSRKRGISLTCSLFVRLPGCLQSTDLYDIIYYLLFII